MFRYFSENIVNESDCYGNNYPNNDYLPNNYFNNNNNEQQLNHDFNYNNSYYPTNNGFYFNQFNDRTHENEFKQSANYSVNTDNGLVESNEMTDLDDNNCKFYSQQNQSYIHSNHIQYKHLKDDNQRFDFHQRSVYPKLENGFQFPSSFDEINRNQFTTNNLNNFAMHSNRQRIDYHFDRNANQYSNYTQIVSYPSKANPSHTYTPSLNSSTISPHNSYTSVSSVYSDSEQVSTDPTKCDKYFYPLRASTPKLIDMLPPIGEQINDLSSISPVSSSQSCSQSSTQSSIPSLIECSIRSPILTSTESSLSMRSLSSTQSLRNEFNKDLVNRKVDKEMRLEIKREKNRKAAAKCRQKKLEQIRRYEKHRIALINKNLRLEKEVNDKRIKVMEIKQILLNHRFEGFCQMVSHK